MSILETSEVQEYPPAAPHDQEKCWPVVLAGGEGRRMVRWIEGRNGEVRPKQFCTFTGSRTMLQHTQDRAVQVAPARNVITIIGRGQRKFLPDHDAAEIPGRLIEQPANRGTAAGVLLAATYVRARDPEATVLILPSDHFIHPDYRFRQHVAHACRLAERFTDRFVLLGAIAAGAHTDYGWILPERTRLSDVPDAGYEVRMVARFREKPAPEEAATLFGDGALWNTLVLAVKVKAVWKAAGRLLPGMTERFEFLRRVLRSIRTGRLGREREEEVLQDIYLDMEPADFSRDLLQYVGSATLVQSMRGVEWSDWGRPERVEQTLRRFGKRPALGPVPLRPATAQLEAVSKPVGGGVAPSLTVETHEVTGTRPGTTRSGTLLP
jgi:mannose-1-phosphate guanylyltransferase